MQAKETRSKTKAKAKKQRERAKEEQRAKGGKGRLIKAESVGKSDSVCNTSRCGYWGDYKSQ
jgi:hypothetical protein